MDINQHEIVFSNMYSQINWNAVMKGEIIAEFLNTVTIFPVKK